MSTRNTNEIADIFELVRPFLRYKVMRFDKFYDVRKSNLKNIAEPLKQRGLELEGLEKNGSCQLNYLKNVCEALSDDDKRKKMEKEHNVNFDAKEFLQYLYLDYAENQRSDMLDPEALEFIEQRIGYKITEPDKENNKNDENGLMTNNVEDFRNDLKNIFDSQRLTKNIDDIRVKNDALGVYATVDNKSYLMASVSNLIRYYKQKYSLNDEEVAILHERAILEARMHFWEHFWGFWSLNVLLSFVTVSAMVGFVFAFIPLAAPLVFVLTTSACIAINYWINYVRYPKDWSWKNLKTYEPALDYFKSETFKQNIGLKKQSDVKPIVPLQTEQSLPENPQKECAGFDIDHVAQTNSKLKFKLVSNIFWNLFKVTFVFAAVLLAFNFIPGAIPFLSGIKAFASIEIGLLTNIVQLSSYIISGLTAAFGVVAGIGKLFYSKLKKNKIVIQNRDTKKLDTAAIFLGFNGKKREKIVTAPKQSKEHNEHNKNQE